MKKNWIKSICFAFVFVAVMAFANQAKATNLPFLDFGLVVDWDGTTLTDGSISYVIGGIYEDTTPFAWGDAVTGSDVNFSITFDDISNDTFVVDGWFTADVIGAYSTINPIDGFTILLDNVVVDPSSETSQWWDEFSAAMVGPIDGQVIFSPLFLAGENTYNGFGKVTAVPEPATIALLGIGLAGLAGAGARRKMKKKVRS